MKLRAMPFLFLWAGVLLCRGQLALNPGDVWTYSFNTMAFQRTELRYARPYYGSLGITFGHFANGSTLRFEMFESSTADSPLATGLITSGSDFATLPFTPVWQDLNGAVRLTMLTGACSIASVSVSAGTPTPIGFNWMAIYGTQAPLTSPRPALAVRSLANSAEVSWWTNGTSGYVLEATNVVAPGPWPTVPIAPSIVSDRNVVTLSSTGQVFFRLRK